MWWAVGIFGNIVPDNSETQMNNPEFWSFFNTEAYPKLENRQQSMKYLFEYLDRLGRPVFVVETGCVRKMGTWSEEGQSTILFDRFVSQLPGSVMHSVDLAPQATALCRTLVSSSVQLHTGDSVAFLRTLARNPPPGFKYIDVLYLDSLDVDFANPHPSALHHMKELLAISTVIGPQTLVVVDDSPMEASYFLSPQTVNFVSKPVVSGKAKYVADYAETIGLAPVFTGYQVGWIGF
jgi:hypothetical protein